MDTKHTDKARSGTFAGSAPFKAFEGPESEFWRKQYERESYFDKGMTFDDYEPAYRYGYESYKQYPGRKFADVEHDMSGGWDKVKGKSRLAWERAKHAVRAAWDRVEGAVRGEDKEHAKHR